MNSDVLWIRPKYYELDYQDRKNNFDIRDVKLFESNIVFSSSGKSIVS